jgi:hypothetical protein
LEYKSNDKIIDSSEGIAQVSRGAVIASEALFCGGYGDFFYIAVIKMFCVPDARAIYIFCHEP